MELSICEECQKAVKLIIRGGDQTCPECSTVQSERVIDDGKEWREFDNDDDTGKDRARVEINDDDFNMLGTFTSMNNYGSAAGSKSLTTKIILKCNSIVNESQKKEQTLKEVFKRVAELSTKLGLSGNKIEQDAKRVVQKVEGIKNNNLRGLKKDTFLVAVLLFASKQQKGGKTLKSVTRVTGLNEKEVKRYYKMLLREPSFRNPDERIENKPTTNQVEELVRVYSNQLFPGDHQMINLSLDVAFKSIEFLEGTRPSSIAAASVMYVLKIKSGFNASKQRELAQMAGVTCNTVRKVLKKIDAHTDQLPYSVFGLEKCNMNEEQ